MSGAIRNQKNILAKLKIESLNKMQEEAHAAIHSNSSTVLLSPTGTGKTLAFLLPVVAQLNPKCSNIQALILVPSRELAIQIEQVIREMGSGYKANAFYGGRGFTKDRIDLNHPPAILIGTPGRIADHLRRDTFVTDNISTIVLDEFDKSLEVGFEADMRDIIDNLPNLSKRILTSATEKVQIPEFVGINNPAYVDYLDHQTSQLSIKTVVSPDKDKLQSLLNIICFKGDKPGIVFCNFRDTIQQVSDFLNEHGIAHGCFYGTMEQQDRERALIKFRNSSHQLLLSTDLAARGIDVPELDFIIHYELPPKEHEFTHRNGRTARMNSQGTAYIIKWEKESLPPFLANYPEEYIHQADVPYGSLWSTLFISGGRKDKISKGDIAGILYKQGNLTNDQIGVIELKTDCAFVAVHSTEIDRLVKTLNNVRLKNKKVRVYQI